MVPYYLDSTFIEEFYAKVEKTVDGCWLWQGTPEPSGYGRLWVWEGDKRVQRMAHVVSLEIRLQRRLMLGENTRGRFQANHVRTCLSLLCIHPEHLYEGTQLQNMADMAAAGNQRNRNTSKVVCPKCLAPYDRVTPDGRRCSACYLAHQRAYNKTRPSRAKVPA